MERRQLLCLQNPLIWQRRRNIQVLFFAHLWSQHKTEEHKHPTKYEIFYVLKGKAKFAIGGVEKVVFSDEIVIIEPNELHSQSNPFNEDVEWLYFGLATD